MKTWHVIADPAWKGKHPLHDARFVATCDESEIEVTEHEDGEKSWRFKDPENSIICTLPDSPNQKEHARLICRAVNSHADLLEACKRAYASLQGLRESGDEQDWESYYPLHKAYELCQAAIQKAEGAL